MNNYLRISEVAALKQVCYDTVLLAIKERRLPAEKLLGMTVVTREAAAAWQPVGGRGRRPRMPVSAKQANPVHRQGAIDNQVLCGVWYPEHVTKEDGAVTCRRCRRSMERSERLKRAFD